ncbi:serine/threonine-protein phosphatase 6 regulatory subunit 1 isoform X6 [Gopherus evgoodei]|nr:serine/threonine-protein phosphatase 6 regulatory subunit 1 isoform X6 [Gopherus evgoodei]XP_030400639.1 serine/threonine-protein phosphatase 6 regulatory subunit 1 isoform X6 [Gopherus evgoodei]
MFWKFDLHSSSHIETLLERADLTLRELLDEDDVLQECKVVNRRLLDFLVQPQHMEALVTCVTEEPPVELDERLRYKYPSVSCEILTSDVSPITDALGEDEGLLRRLYGFLQGHGVLNPLLASFFSKVMGILINRKTDQIVAFLRKKDDFVSLLLRHIGTSAIMDLLLRLLTCVEQPVLRQDVFNWLNEEKIVQRLIEMIHPSKDDNQHSNASQSLCDIIRLSREQMMQIQDSPEPDQLLATLEKQETVEQLLGNMLAGEQDESVIVSGIQVLLTLLEPRRARSEAGGMGSFYCPLEGQLELAPLGSDGSACQASPSTLLALRGYLRDFHQLLIDPPKRPALQMTWGLLDPPLGNTRLQVVKLLGSSLGAGDAGLQEELLGLDALNTMLDLYFKYTYNNFLHAQLEACLSTLLRAGTPTEDSQPPPYSPVVKHLLQKCRLVQRILSAWEENEQTQAAGGQRRGYMGHLTRIANALVQSSEKGPHVALVGQLLKELPEEEQEQWEKFVSGPLAETNKKNVVDLVNMHNLHSSSDDEENDLKEFNFPQEAVLQQAFVDYQMQQVTSAFIDHFGFNDEEFGEQEESVNAHFRQLKSAPFDRTGSLSFSLSADDDSPNSNLFEVCYKERIQQFDDDDSDGEDAWQEKELGYSGGCPQPTGPRSCGSTDSEGSRDSEEEEDAGGGVEGGGGGEAEGASPDLEPAAAPARPPASGGVDTGVAVWDRPGSDASRPPTEGSWALFTETPSAQTSQSDAPSGSAEGPHPQEPTSSNVSSGGARKGPPCLPLMPPSGSRGLQLPQRQRTAPPRGSSSQQPDKARRGRLVKLLIVGGLGGAPPPEARPAQGQLIPAGGAA